MRSHCLTQIDLADIWDDRHLANAVSIYAFGETGPHGHIMKRIMVHYIFQLDSHIFNKTLNVVLVDINECSSSPCMNGATCTDAVNSYTCACVAGYTGTHCETGGKLGLSNL